MLPARSGDFGVWMKLAAFICLLALFSGLMAIPALAAAPTTTPTSTAWVTNGDVNVVRVSGSTVYLGGTFTQVGPYTGSGVPVDSAGTVLTGYDKIAYLEDTNENAIEAAYVNTVIADGAGGWYAGGYFNNVGGESHSRLVHLSSEGKVDSSFTASLNGDVYSLLLDGSTLYVAGLFTGRFKALNASDGSEQAGWTTVSGAVVNTMAISGTTLFLGADANLKVGGVSKKCVAAISTSTKALIAGWTVPLVTGTCTVNSLAVSGTNLYVGGNYANIGGRAYLEALSTADGTLVAGFVPPAPNASVLALLVSGGKLYLGGTFSSLAANARGGLAAVSPSDGTIDAWTPTAITSPNVKTIDISGTTLYAGGVFSSVSGTTRNNLAAFATDTGSLVAGWDPSSDGLIHSLVVSSGTIYIGGEYRSLGAAGRSYLAAFDDTTGELENWNPSGVAGTVNDILVNGETVYVAYGSGAGYIKAFQKSDGAAVDGWGTVDAAGGTILTMALSADGLRLYLGGSFTTVLSGQSRAKVAAVDASTGSLVAGFNATNANNTVYSLLYSGSTLYAGGNFTTIGNQTIGRLAKLDATGVGDSSWNPNANGIVYTLANKDSNTLFAGGYFAGASSIGGQTRNYLAAINKTTGNADASWDPDPDSRIYAMALDGDILYVGGSFWHFKASSVGRRALAAVSTSGTGGIDAWNPDVSNYSVYGLAAANSTVYTGGNFKGAGSTPHPSYLQFGEGSGASPTPTPTSAPTSTPTPIPASSSAASNTSQPPGCGAEAPAGKPWLYGAIPQSNTSILLYFTDADGPIDSYFLEYGTASGVYQYGSQNIGGRGTRTYLVQGLTPNKTYYFRVRAGNGCATGQWSNELAAETGKGKAATPTPTGEPVTAAATPTPTPTVKQLTKSETKITNLDVSRIREDSALVTWQTNHPATTRIDYGLSTDFLWMAESDDLTKNHAVQITGLQPDTVYFFEVTSQGKTLAKSSSSFKTNPIKETKPPGKPTPTVILSVTPSLTPEPSPTPTPLPTGELAPTPTPLAVVTTAPARNPVAEAAESLPVVSGAAIAVNDEVGRLRDQIEKNGVSAAAGQVATTTVEAAAVTTVTVLTASAGLAAAETSAASFGLLSTLNLGLVSTFAATLRQGVVMFFSYFVSLLGLIKKRRKTLGVVYNSISGRPISRARVVFYSSSGYLQTVLTNNAGRFSLKVPAGEYLVRVIKKGYLFPSKIINVSENDEYSHIYHQDERIKLAGEPSSNLAIPLDPEEKSGSVTVALKRTWSRLTFLFHHYYYFLNLMVLALVTFAYLSHPSTLNLISWVSLLGAVLVSLVHTLQERKDWGRVVDSVKHKGLPNLLLKLYRRTASGRIDLYSLVQTDEKGRYVFVPEDGKYLLKVLSLGNRVLLEEAVVVNSQNPKINLNLVV